MIRYALKCPENHGFESWFASSDAFEALQNGKMLSCPICGDKDITKAMMAPKLAASGKAAPAEPVDPQAQSFITSPSREVREAMERLRKAVEANSDYVGDSFAREARAIHSGNAPERAIHGEADAEETRALIEDGVPVLPLPFLPGRKLS